VCPTRETVAGTASKRAPPAPSRSQSSSNDGDVHVAAAAGQPTGGGGVSHTRLVGGATAGPCTMEHGSRMALELDCQISNVFTAMRQNAKWAFTVPGKYNVSWRGRFGSRPPSLECAPQPPTAQQAAAIRGQTGVWQQLCLPQRPIAVWGGSADTAARWWLCPHHVPPSRPVVCCALQALSCPRLAAAGGGPDGAGAPL
jgi:hypothetical protein